MSGWLPRVLVASLGLLLATRAEWVEIPQFSDQRKVYRAPTLHGSLPFRRPTDLRNISGFSGHSDSILTSKRPAFVGHDRPHTVESEVINSSDEKDEITSLELDDEDIQIESVEEETFSQFVEPPVMDDFHQETTTTMSPIESTTLPLSTHLSITEQYNNNERDDDTSFLNYLPIELFKRVHKTLKSQPPNLKGKIRFLKAFERNLLSEIESRLSAALSPSRIPREARDRYYNIEDHDDKIGFPSLEGTLMAISFLTFAVYLVRLVMMLFKNAGMAGVAPIIIGRKKRSIDDSNEERVRILSYLGSALPRH